MNKEKRNSPRKGTKIDTQRATCLHAQDPLKILNWKSQYIHKENAG